MKWSAFYLTLGLSGTLCASQATQEAYFSLLNDYPCLKEYSGKASKGEI